MSDDVESGVPTPAPDLVEGLESLREDFDREAKKYNAASSAVTVSSIKDASRSIEVILDPSNVLRIEVGDGWRSAYGAKELGTAVTTTVALLAAERMKEWGEAAALKDDGETPTASAQPSLSESASTNLQGALDVLDDEEGSALLDQMMTMLQEVNDGMEAAMDIIAARTQTTHAAGNPDTVTVAIDGTGGITSVVFDEEWLTNRTGYDITRELNAAIAKAAGLALTAAPKNVFDGTPLAKYGDILNDPDALTRILLRKD